MPQFFIMGNNLKHYFCYIVSNLRWQYPPSCFTVTLLVIYTYNRWIHAGSVTLLSRIGDRMARRKQAKLLLERRLSNFR